MSSEQLRAMHTKIDANGDGKVTFQETMDYYVHMRQEVAKKDMDMELDADGDGKFTFDELMKGDEAENEADKDEHETYKAVELAKFGAADTNGDGALDADELPGFWHPETKEAVLQIATKASLDMKDKDKDGELTEAEFLGDDVDDEDAETSDEEKKHFRKLDTDGSGKLSLDELKRSDSLHSETAIQQIFETADQDADGHITADELEAAGEKLTGTDAHYQILEWVEHHEL